ncbi:hypothetical protein HXX76_008142 [Chlamydomonas incerta]|uniref:Nucleoporin Nup54 alpha-helical domain-containing protein n=1 Tax=Chlamydomonas incerta TaxID=51695 RepID=A0A835W1R4_CHLIN|nr:hypothetical protein HXX76_008142 [Chlamydomonas incerta]|eukprot:KAG2433784.1 hypothetical protein HXX76_008142 [Chlamydomonas incerta]
MASPFSFGAAPAAPPASPFGFSTANAAAAAPNTAPAPGATGGLFGVSSTPAGGFSFGTAAAAAAPAATPAFGTTAFGAAAAPKPATGGAFSFGAATTAPAAGATAAAPAFGATTSTFGAPAATPSLFGTTPAQGFGATTATQSLFGAAAAPATGSAFNFSSAPAAGTATTGLFGAPAAATTAANIFGQPAQQPGQQANMFGAAAQLPGLDPSGLTQDDAVRALTRLAAAYTPSSADYRFQTLFASVVERPEQRVKPAGHVDENRWRAALAAIKGPDNPQKLWPVAANGFRDLNTRSRMQAEAVAQNANRLRELQDRAAAMSRRAAGEFRSRVAALQRQHTDLSHKLLHVMRCVDALESRLALSAGYNAQQSRQQVAELGRQLGRLEEAVAPASAAAGLERRLEAVAAAARMRAGSAESSGGVASVNLDERSQAQLFAVLRDHAEAVRQLQGVLKGDELDVEVLKRLVAAGPAGPGGVGAELASAAMSVM